MSSFVVVTGSWRGPPPPPCLVSNFRSHTKQKIPLPVWPHLLINIISFFQSTNKILIWAWRVPPLFTDKVFDKKEKCKNIFWSLQLVKVQWMKRWTGWDKFKCMWTEFLRLSPIRGGGSRKWILWCFDNCFTHIMKKDSINLFYQTQIQKN